MQPLPGTPATQRQGPSLLQRGEPWARVNLWSLAKGTQNLIAATVASAWPSSRACDFLTARHAPMGCDIREGEWQPVLQQK